MKLTTVTCLADFIDQTSALAGRGTIFRGVANAAAHPLVPPIGRAPRWSRLTRSDLANEERAMLTRFRQEGAAHVPSRLSSWDWLALARHHHLPGRCLAWTRQPLVALYFAVQGSAAEAGAVYGERFQRKLPSNDTSDPWTLRAAAQFTPSEVHPSIRAQATVLSIHPDPRAAYDSRSLVCLRVSGKLKRHLKHELGRMGIEPGTVFPGLDGIAQRIVQ